MPKPSPTRKARPTESGPASLAPLALRQGTPETEELEL